MEWYRLVTDGDKCHHFLQRIEEALYIVCPACVSQQEPIRCSESQQKGAETLSVEGTEGNHAEEEQGYIVHDGRENEAACTDCEICIVDRNNWIR
jgi:hypothetical protein